jgi:hypothetical protein
VEDRFFKFILKNTQEVINIGDEGGVNETALVVVE